MVYLRHLSGLRLKMNKRNLLITYCFPPIAAPESYLVAKLFANLPLNNFDVITIEPFKTWMKSDIELERHLLAKIPHIFRVKVPKWKEHLPLTKKDVKLVNLGAGGRVKKFALGILINQANLILKSPDPFRFYNRDLQKTLRSKKFQYRNIVTWSQYNSTALIGLKLKKKYGNEINWIAYFGDPWHLNPYIPLRGLSKRLNHRMQTLVFENADLLIFPTQEMLNYVMDGYGDDVRDKCKILSHSYDPELYLLKTALNQKHDRLKFKYIGQFYGNRSPEIIYDALAILYRESPDILKKIQIEFIGGNNPKEFAHSKYKNLPEGLITFRGQLSYLDSLKEMLTADCLISLDAPAKENIFMSAKISDYIGAAKPIIAFTNKGATSKLIRSYGGWIANPLSPTEGAEAFRSASNFVSENGDKLFGSSQIRNELSAKHVGLQFSAIIEELS